MRVLFCLKGPNEINGPNVWLTRHLPLLAAHGITPRVLYVAEDPDEPCRFLSALQAQGVGATKVKLGRFTDDDVPLILQGIAAERPDVFVPNYTPSAYFACRFAREAGIHTIGTLHSDDPYYHDIVDVFLRGAAAWRLSGIVSVSDYLHDVAREAASPGTRVLHATYGAPLPPSVARDGEELVLLYVGRLVERQKRIRRVVDRLCAATMAVPGVSAVLYGEGSEREWAEATILARGQGRVTLGGGLPPDAMQTAMLEGHALVLLSDFEGLSIALMEAMACGLVPIVSDLRSGTGDLIRHEENALIVDPDSEEDFVRAVRRLRDEPGLRARLGQAARDTIVATRYTSDECARKWAAFCRDLPADLPRRPVRVPDAEAMDLPPRCTRPFGLRIGDRRDPLGLLLQVTKTGRPIVMWGASVGGRQFLASPTGRRVRLHGIVDRRADGRLAMGGHVVQSPDVLERRRGARDPFVIIASMYEEEIARELGRLGYRCEVDFIAV